MDGVLLNRIVHHFPDPRQLASEVRRVLKPGGRFAAVDHNRMNPFMGFIVTVHSARANVASNLQFRR
jgi:SAM-dependent methyltransferase